MVCYQKGEPGFVYGDGREWPPFGLPYCNWCLWISSTQDSVPPVGIPSGVQQRSDPNVGTVALQYPEESE